MTMAILRFNFAAPQDDPAARRDRINAGLELGSWAETRGVSAVSIDEHHQSGHGWSCNPIMTAAVFLARTERIVASVDSYSPDGYWSVTYIDSTTSTLSSAVHVFGV